MHSDTSSVRRGEELNLEVLQSYLTGKIEGAEGGILVEQFPGGHSNLTYLLEIGGKEYVLRRAPLGPVAPKAHDMARESRVLQAIHPHFPPAPEVFLLCEDPSVLGAVFFLMERRRGTIIRDEIPEDIAAQPEYPRRISEALIDCMVQLHAIDIEKTGLIKIGKPEGFLQRQVGGWAERWHRAVLEPQPAMNRVIEFLQGSIPPSGKPTLVHNDFKLDNVMLGQGDPDKVVAVLDWEMTTVGDPLCDLGLTLLIAIHRSYDGNSGECG
ncbi:MAG: phosphotransferase family protein, partial [Bryobacteraceae bacterium]